MKKLFIRLSVMIVIMLFANTIASYAMVDFDDENEVEPQTLISEKIEEESTPSNTLISEKTDGDSKVKTVGASEGLVAEEKTFSIQKIIASAISFYIVISLFCIIYLVVETILIAYDKKVDSVWHILSNVLIALSTGFVGFGIPAIIIVVKLFAKGKKTKIVSNILAIIAIGFTAYVITLINTVPVLT